MYVVVRSRTPPPYLTQTKGALHITFTCMQTSTPDFIQQSSNPSACHHQSWFIPRHSRDAHPWRHHDASALSKATECAYCRRLSPGIINSSLLWFACLRIESPDRRSTCVRHNQPSPDVVLTVLGAFSTINNPSQVGRASRVGG